MRRAATWRCAPGEIVGVAGVSGNGQRELMEALTGQRRAPAAASRVDGERLRCRPRAQNRRLQGAQPARGAAAQRLRRRAQRGREHGAAQLRRARRSRRAGLARARRRMREPCAATGSPRTSVKTHGPRARRSARCRAATCSARCWRASSSATRELLIVANPVLRPGLPVPWPRSTRRLRAARDARRRGAAGQRGPRRAAGTGRPHRR
ncbi:MAG: hypothetical protein MZW92_60370 [Comamonadaceae bacterium]|nr:hypothetical protein [Comamonadaceae bacterium]